MRLVAGSAPVAREWSNRTTNAAIWSSLLLAALGVYFLARGRRTGTAPSRWIGAALIVAALPAALAAIVIVMRR